ncbi:small nuclear ribonucleoprotein U1a [Mytilinidion resinicola]|uniref:Small nuclear ribonucleoprotein U1a n=1 Tax=Mytilinidion resinicola TaxID=574789 RepID=A0A6A6Y3E4_9PEZI|nr:small nuclear ribonucleoprotein U1a [Mytilinidion resinicola]KAF2803043.1 small nuclear ribonucleoprotein U1a [Mytilinidion resinicola]
MAAVQQPGGDPPISTVYVRNLEERIKIEPLKEALHEIFSDFGTIIEIVAKTSLKRKGQAFIVFEDPEAAAEAINAVQGFDLFDKPMQLELARTRSDATVKRIGTEEDFEAHKRRRLAEKDLKQAQEATEAQKTRPAGGAEPGQKPARGPAKPAGGIPDEYLPPNKDLLVRNLPDEFDGEAFNGIFENFDGFKSATYVAGRNLGFVYFESEAHAITAKERTANLPVGEEGKPIMVTYAKV